MRIFLNVIVLILFGCAQGIPLQRAQLKTDGIEIVVNDNPLIIKSFQPFKPVGVAPSACYTDGIYQTSTPVLFSGSAASQLTTGIKAGAIPVQVNFVEKRTSLFGRLLFCPIVSSAEADGIQEYEIYIPQKFIDEALSGKLTAVFKKTNLSSGWKQYLWILWLANEPLTDDNIAKFSIEGDSTEGIQTQNAKSQSSGDSDSALMGALLIGAAVGAVSPGDTMQQITTGLQATAIATNTLASQKLEELQRMAELENNTTSRRTSQSSAAQGSASNPSTTGANSSCPPNFNHLSSEMPEFRDSFLQDIRQSILDTSVAGIISASKQQGMSKSQTISMALRQADEFESTARINAKAGAEVSTELTTRGIVTSVKTGRLPLSIPCGGSASMVQAAQCGVISQIWGAKMNRELAKFIQMCW